jgi:hypothetical protein
MTEITVKLAGTAQIAIAIAALGIPKILDWRGKLTGVHPFLRKLFWVYSAYIVAVIAGFGALSLICACDLTNGSNLSRYVCGFIALFWLARLIIQLFVFDTGTLAISRWIKLGYHGLTVSFVYLAATYGSIAIEGFTP